MKANETKLQPILEGVKQYLVPLFQRSYSWKRNLWDTLWDDLLELYEANDGREHFIGAIVTMPVDMSPHGVSKYLLIDGQQRLTTIFILLAAIRDLARETQDDKLAAQIDETYLVNKWEDGVNKLKLLPTQADREEFSQLIRRKPSTSSNSLTDVYQFFRHKLTEHDESGNPFDLKKVQIILTQQFVAVSIVLAKDENPYLIFESLNAKGEPLTQADLVRNYIFMRIENSGEQQVAYNDLWLPMQQTLGDELSNFLWRYLTKDGTFVRQGSIYEAIKARLTHKTPSEVVDILLDMHTYSDYYIRLINPQKETNKEIRQRLERINRWEIKTAYPFILALYHDYENSRLLSKEFCKILDNIESFVIRRFFCRVSTNVLNRIFIAMYRSLEGKNTPEAVEEQLLARNWPADGEFLDGWRKLPIYLSGTAKTRHLLESLESQMLGNNEPVDMKHPRITIEHVMPQTLNEEWETDLGAEALRVHQTYLHTIGNLTLTGNNEPMGNSAFFQKKKVFLDSNFELNKYFKNSNLWNEKTIRSRSLDLGKVAVDIWRRPKVDETVTMKVNPTGHKPTGFTFLGERCEVDTWREMFSELLTILANRHKAEFVAKATSIAGSKRAYVSRNKEVLRSPVLLAGFDDLWIETNLSSAQTVSVLKQMVEVFGYKETDFEAHW